jgi:hypothetical protein
MSKYFAIATASIWISAGVCKLYYTKRVADLFATKGYPIPEVRREEKSPADDNRILRVSVLDEANPGESRVHEMLSGSKTLCYATTGTFVAALGFWLLSPHQK